MFHSMVADIITQTFTKEVGKWQTKNSHQKAFRVSFRTKINHDTEDGYRFIDLVIYGPMNYVGVYVRERWTVIPLEDLVDTEDGDTEVKPGKDYQSGASAWSCLSYHDSGWRSAIPDFLFKNRENIQGFDGVGSFYEVVDVPAEILEVFK